MNQIATFLSVVSIVTLVNGREIQNHYKMEQNGNGYNFSFDFESTLTKDSILNILFNFEHLVKYSSQINRMEVLSSEKNSYVVSFFLKYLFYTSESVFRRTLLPDKDMVLIEMLNFTHNSAVIPEILKARIEYRVIQKERGVQIFYNQQCLLNKQINWIYMKILESKINESIKQLQQYISSLN